MAQVSIAAGATQLVIAPAGVPVTVGDNSVQLGLTAAGAATGPTIATGEFTWPESGASLVSIQSAPTVQPGYVPLFVYAASAATINYAS